jgi:hypothetical protein
MQFVYKPEGVEPKSWEFKPERMLSAECIEIEKRTGWDYSDWLERFKRANMGAIQAYLYVMLRREEHGLKYDDVSFCLEEVAFEPSPEELSDARARLEEKRDAEGLTDSEASTLAQLVADDVPLPAPKD